MKIRSLIFVACMTLALPASGQDQSARSLLRLAQAREGIWDTILELQIRYLQRTVPAKNRPALVSYYLGRALLLRGDASAARRVLLASPHNSNLLHGRLTALWLRVAQNKNIEQSLPAPDCTPVDCLVAAERGFLLAWRENPTAGHKIVKRAWELARRRDLVNTQLRRCMAYTALRVGDLEEARTQLSRLTLSTPETRLGLDAVTLENGQSLESDVVLYAPEVFFCRALLTYHEAASAAVDQTPESLEIRTRALIGAGLADKAQALLDDPRIPKTTLDTWRVGLQVRSWKHRPVEETFGEHLFGEPSIARLRRGAQVLDELLERPALAVAARKRLLVRMKKSERWADMTLSRFLDAARPDASALAASLLAADRPAQAFFLMDLLYDKGRRSSLWEFDIRFLTRLGQTYLRLGRYGDLIQYLYRRRTIPELAEAAPAVRVMARELQAFQSFDRQRVVVAERPSHTRPTLESVLFGIEEAAVPIPARPVIQQAERTHRGTPNAARKTRGMGTHTRAMLGLLVCGFLALSAGVWSHRYYLIRKYRF